MNNIHDIHSALIDPLIDRSIDSSTDGRMDSWVDEWMHEWMDGWFPWVALLNYYTMRTCLRVHL